MQRRVSAWFLCKSVSISGHRSGRNSFGQLNRPWPWYRAGLRTLAVYSALLFVAAVPAWGSVSTDVSVSTDLSAAGTQIVSPSFSTASGNELLLAFIATDSTSSPMTVTSVTGGGLTWMPVARANTSGGGTAEIWRAFAVAPLSNATVTAALAQSVFASMQVVSFSGVDSSGSNGSGAIGAVATAAGVGAPSASLTTTRANSLVFGVGNDFDNARARTAAAGQTLVHQDLSAPNNDTYWMQRVTAAVAASGTTVKINDTAPTGDHFNLAICEILAPSGTAIPSIVSVSPNSGNAGTSVVISGSNLGSTQGNGNVTFNGTAATITNWSNSSITAIVPYGASTGKVVVAAGDGISSNGAAFSVTPGSGLAIDAVAGGNLPVPGTAIHTQNFSTTAGSELLLALIATDAQSAGMHVTSVSGGGLTWTLVQRANTQLGDAEIWRAFAPGTLSNISVAATLSQSVVASLQVLTFTGADPSGSNGAGAIGAISSGNANPGAPSAVLTTTRANSWIFGVGNDYDKSISRTLGPGQALLNQYWSPTHDTYWMQRRNNTTSASGTAVTINDIAPSADRYNLAIVEVLPTTGGGAAPIINSLSPTAGEVGNAITVTGSNFGATQGSSTVTFAGTAGAPQIWSSTQIVVPVPPGVTIGNVPVVVTTTNGTSNAATFTDVNVLAVSAVAAPPANVAGWNHGNVTITYTCSGGVPPVVCPGPHIVSSEGASQTVVATATDAVGNLASASVQVSLDKTPPQIVAVASPLPDVHGINTTGVTVTFNCSDSISGVSVCPPAVTTTTSGANQVVSGQAVDKAGNTAAASVTLNIETTPLSIVATASPAANAAGWNKSNVTVSFQCSGGAPPVHCPPSQLVTTEAEGQSTAGTATDADGNSVTAAVSISLDKTPPALSITAPVDGSNATATQIAVSGTIADGVSGTSILTCNGVPVAITGPSFTCNVTLVPGSNPIAVVATDVAGNTVSLIHTVVHVTPINLQITSPGSLQLFSTNPIVVSGTVDTANATVVVGGVTAVVSNGAFTASGVVLREGKNLLTASATSAGGGLGSDTIAVFLDTSPPAVHIDSPSAGAILTSPQIDVTGNVNDAVSGTVNGDQVSVTVNGVAGSVANRSFAAHGVLLVPGTNTITATATDRAGNTTQHQVQVTLQQNVGQQTLSIVSGNDQSAPINTVLPLPLVVQATDAIGRPMVNRTLSLAVSKSDGVLISGQQKGRALTLQTDLNGNATVQFQVGSRNGAGINQITVSAPGFAGAAVFSADSTVAGPSLIFTVSGEMQTGLVGAPLAEPLVAIVLDAGANPVPNVPVTFAVKSGGGLIGLQTNFTQNTDSDGKAFAVLVLGQQSGTNNNAVTASFAGLSSPPAVFTSSGVIPGPVAQTTVSGTVLDDANQPIPNATASIKGTTLSALTNANGRFTISNAPVGNIVLFIDGSTSTDPDPYPTLSFQMATLPGVDNSLPGPIYLPEIDTSNSQVVGGDQDVILTMAGVPGVEYKVFAHSVTFPDGSHVGPLTLSQVHADKVPMTPPNGTAPRLVGTLQPAAVKFDPPIQMTLPNTDGLAPGQVIELFSFHHDIEQFVTEGTGRVSDDGSVVVSDPGFGLTVSGWHGGGGNPPPPDCVVNVFVNIDSAPDELNVDDQGSASATGNPSDTPPGCPASAPAFSWSSTSPSVLDVSGSDSTAALTASAEGEADITVEYQDAGVTATQQKHVTVSPLKLDCSNIAPTRGDSTTCTVSHFPQGATFKWEFDGNDGGVVKKTSNSNQWSGVIVESGTVNVQVIKADGSAVKTNPSPVTLTVSARTGGQWQMSNPTPTSVPNGGVKDNTGRSITLPTPPQPGPNCGTSPNESGTGCSGFSVGGGRFTTKPVNGGPNTGYQYLDVPLSMTVADGFFYNYELNPDLENTQSTFYLAQCGDFPQNPGGFISGADLRTQNARHEYAGAQQSHYAFFISTFPPHDLEVFFEQQVMTVGNDPTAFAADVSSKLKDRITAIIADTNAKGEPAAVNNTEAGQPLGNINYTAPAHPGGYVPCAPTITSLAPLSGAVNSGLTINGYDFGDSQVAGSTVTVGGQPATVGSWNKNAVVVTIPQNLQPGTVQVVITTTAGTSSTPFTVTKP